MSRFTPERYVKEQVQEYKSYKELTEGKKVKGRASTLREWRAEIKYWAKRALEWRKAGRRVRIDGKSKTDDSRPTRTASTVFDRPDTNIAVHRKKTGAGKEHRKD